MLSMLECASVLAYFRDLQDRLADQLKALDPDLEEQADEWTRPEGGGGRTRAFRRGQLVEKGGINYSHVTGAHLPSSATRSRPHLEGHSFEAMGVSVVFHPLNPFVPCTHLNVRFFSTSSHEAEPLWWFGGGFDLTPVYPFVEDAVEWHQAAQAACLPFGEDLYPRFKEACDAYFHLPHRKESRGIGGIFFDDFNELGPDASFAFTRSVGDAFMPAWKSIVEKRRHIPWGERERAFQAYRRGRYVEFNLLHDRGTRFGLQSGGRTESILVSMPPLASWDYAYEPQPGSREAALTSEFLRPRDWLALNPSCTT